MSHVKSADNSSPRDRVAREAASLLYSRLEKEYCQAKLKAAQNLGVRVLPSNFEVALELDRMAEETEGPTRVHQLIDMRTEALKVMTALRSFCPRLIGSVWRGTARRGSDIDIEVFCNNPDEVLAALKSNGVVMSRVKRVAVTDHGTPESSLHFYGESPSKYPVEITIRSADKVKHKRCCDIFGDEIKGLSFEELKKVLSQYPSQKFVP